MKNGIRDNKKLIEFPVIAMIFACILLNFLLSKLALYFELPLFLDSVGTIFCAVTSGILPGIIVGFSTNLINGITDPITLYYGIISVMIAITAAVLARRRCFTSWWKTLLSVFYFAFLGGIVGSLLTWMLYGFGLGSGISAPFARYLYDDAGLSVFTAQLMADFIIDIADKFITIAIVFAAVRLAPPRFMKLFPLGIYSLRGSVADGEISAYKMLGEKNSLRKKVLLLIIISSSLLGVLSIVIGSITYRSEMNDNYIAACESAANLMALNIDAGKIDGYLAVCDESDESYAETERRLIEIKNVLPNIEYMYVYKIDEDGCHVVFDLDTETLEGEALGTVIAPDEAFSDYWDDLLAGEEIAPVVSNDTYGWLLTVYKPLLTEDGVCAAYAAADISMDSILTEQYIFIIKIISLLFGASIVVVLAAIWFAERKLITPINAMTKCDGALTYRTKNERRISSALVRAVNVRTGDEIEQLYLAMVDSSDKTASYIETIDELQANTIYEFADLVENRDTRTGAHIRHTASFVRIIATQLYFDRVYGDELNEEMISSLELCAPLHDVGKIRISDVILNKPGRLTDEEFAVMKTHTTSGREIISRIIEHMHGLDYLVIARDMAYSHHERWDGGGYPVGLRGGDIPLCARIMAVADVYDALISERSYKAPYSKAEARDIICGESGTHFDPVIVAAFVKAFDKIESVK